MFGTRRCLSSVTAVQRAVAVAASRRTRQQFLNQQQYQRILKKNQAAAVTSVASLHPRPEGYEVKWQVENVRIQIKKAECKSEVEELKAKYKELTGESYDDANN